MSARNFRLFVGMAGVLVTVPMVAWFMVTLNRQLITAPHLLDGAVRATLTNVVIPYLFLALLSVISLAMVDVIKPIFYIVSCISMILVVSLLISAYKRRDHLDAAACSVSCAQHVTNVSNIHSMTQTTAGAYCRFIPANTKPNRLSRCYVHDPQLIVSFTCGYYQNVFGITVVLILMLGGLVLVSSSSSTSHKNFQALWA